MGKDKVRIIRPEWSFYEAAKNSWGFYTGGGLDVRGRVLVHLRHWASMVGRSRAVSELDAFVTTYGGIDKSADSLGIAVSTLKRLRKDFSSVDELPMISTAAPQLSPGEDITGEKSTYTIGSLIGNGGMGYVYKAINSTQESVAVKLLSTSRFTIDGPARKRFLRESKLARDFEHRNVVRSLDAGEHRGLLFSVMELVEGGSLHSVLGRGARLPVPDGLKFMRQLADGLAYLHEKEIIHRDISAKNVLFRKTGELALCDLGIARHALDETVTVGHTPMGSLIYISPQQREDPHTATFEDDVYSLGQLFFYIATGVNPHNAGPINDHANDYDGSVRVVIEQMRQFHRRARPRDAVKVVELLRTVAPIEEAKAG